jgi:hypothetical protein
MLIVETAELLTQELPLIYALDVSQRGAIRGRLEKDRIQVNLVLKCLGPLNTNGHR